MRAKHPSPASRTAIRRSSGSAMVELAAGSILIICVALFALDIGTAMVCFGVNDRACRDAARAAAQGSTATEAKTLANSIVQTFQTNSALISSPQVVNVTYNDFNGTPPAGVSPFVTVTTTATARPIAPFNIFGAQAIAKSFPVRKTYAFPIVKLTVKA
jgi:Flp pilus assembly protein TadG